MTDQELIEYLQDRQWLKPEQLEHCIKMSQEKKIPLLQILHQEKYLVLEKLTSEFLSSDLNTVANDPNEWLENLIKTKITTEESVAHVPKIQDGPSSMDLQVTPFLENSSSLSTLSAQNKPDPSTRYELIENLGSGGMGVVQRVRDRSLGREVALKKIKIISSGKSRISQNEQILLERLKREASITAILEHPNIVPLYDLQEEASGEIFFTMRKIEGQTLRDILKSQRNGKTDLDENHFLSIFLKVCDAIRYAHSKKIIHRDLKPDNIMVGAFGEVYVMDWGLAKRINFGESDTSKILKESLHEALDSPEKEVVAELRTVGGIGTPGYMSPEQAETAKDVHFATDIYSLGKILRECFTFLSPMEEIRFSLTQHQQNAIKKEKPSATLQGSLLDKQVPPEIQAIIQKATQENPQDRYASVLALEEDIERYQKNMRVLVKEYSPLEAFSKWVRRNRQSILIVFFFLFLVTLFAYYAYWKEIQKQENDFQTHYQTALNHYYIGNQMMPEAQSSIEIGQKKTDHLLQSFNLLNRALEIKRHDLQALQKKDKVGEELIQTCCITKQFQLAEVVLQSLQENADHSTLDFQRLQREIEMSKNDTVTQALKRIQEIETRFKNKKRHRGDIKKAIFEISHMQGEAVLNRLVALLQEGTRYLRDQETRDPKLVEFYQMIVEALGRIENIAANEPLLQALQTLGQKVLSFPKDKEVPADFTEYLVLLLIALKNNNALDQTPEIQDIFDQLKTYKTSFTQRTQPFLNDLREQSLSYYSRQIQENPTHFRHYYKRALLSFSTHREQAFQDSQKFLELTQHLPDPSIQPMKQRLLQKFPELK